MATTVRIGGVDIERLKNSIEISKVLNRRQVASFVVVDRDGTADYYRGQSVEIFTGVPIPPFIHPQFTGFIDYPTRQRIAPNGNALYWTINCVDNHYLADKRIAAESYDTPGQTAGDIVTDLFTKYLDPEGVTVGSIEAGPTIEEMVINYSQVSKAFDVLASRADKIWFIDTGLQLYFVDRSTTVAPFAVTSSDIVREGGILSSLAEASPKYRNRQYVRAGKDITVQQTENRTGDGETVAFAMGFPLAKEPDITVDAVVQDVGIKGIDDAKDVYWTYGDSVITFAVAPPLADAIVVEYYGLYDIMIQVDNMPEQLARQAVEGGTGIIEALDDIPDINTKDDAVDAAESTLAHYGVIGKQFTFPIRDWGLEPGQMVTVTHTPYGLSADDLLVEMVRIREVAPGELQYMITAIEGPELGDWTGFFKSMADKTTDIMERITIGKDSVLIILTKFTEGVEVDEVVTQTVYACTACGNAVFCDGILVC